MKVYLLAVCILSFTSLANAEQRRCDAGSLSCLHDIVGSQCGLGSCLPTGTVLGGGLACSCLSGNASGGSICSHGSLGCLHKEFGDTCGFAGKCLPDGSNFSGYSCSCHGGEVPQALPSDPSEPITVPKPGWNFCSPETHDNEVCARTQSTMSFIANGSNLMALDCPRGQLIPLVAMDARSSGLSNLTETISVDGVPLQSIPIVEVEKATVLGKLVGFRTTNALAEKTIGQLKSGSRVEIKVVSSSGRVLHSTSFSLRGSKTSIESLESACN